MPRILITGGSGFLGRGILAYAGEHNWNAEFIVYSRDEYKQDICKRRFSNVRYILGDVKDYDRLVQATKGVDVIIDTAAIKYIPEAEFNVDECIAVNVDGSRNVLKAAFYNKVGTVVGISTDKAVQPINVYGMTKALKERLYGDFKDSVHCTLARYGNVIGSTGSVIPRFKSQLAENGCITITDPTMTRYWISITEAVELIELAMTAKSGSVIIPRPRAMYMKELASTIAAGGHIRTIGLRPGEKMHESLLHEQESIRAIDYGTHYELFPVGSASMSEPFTLSSDKPDAWLQPDELLDAIEQAEVV